MLITFMVVAACTPSNTPRGEKTKMTITASEVIKRLNADDKPMLVDVRQPEELTGPLKALPGVVNIPLPELSSRYSEIPRDKDVVLVCRSGNRSGQAASFLRSKGYTKIKNMQGGMLAVKQTGY